MNHKQTAITRRLMFSVTMIFVVLQLFGCGGGTDGTGGAASDRIVLRGLIKETSGAPVPNAQVKLRETGSSTTTDTQGNFTLSDDVSASNLHIEIVAARFSGTVRISGIPDNKIKINIQVIYDPATDSISVIQSVEITGDLIVEGGDVTIGEVVIVR